MTRLAAFERVERHRLAATERLDRARRAELGQFLTPPAVAAFMATLFERFDGDVRVLDAGAGVGSLLAAFVAEAARRERSPRALRATAFELDPELGSYLRRSLAACRAESRERGLTFESEIVIGDFIDSAVKELERGRPRAFSHAVLNPPYKKLGARSAARLALRRVGIESTNLYTAFVSLAVLLLEPGGELVAITPRSFCNGPYFRPFRELLLRETSLRRLHVFESRKAAFAEDRVLQENVVLHAVKRGRARRVVVSSSAGPGSRDVVRRSLPLSSLVRPGDADRFIRLAPETSGDDVAREMAALPASLGDLGLEVSTGRVVDFRVREHLRANPGARSGPLVYPAHLEGGRVSWPRDGKRPNALADHPETRALFMPRGTYALVRRFSSKEEPRRVVAALFEPTRVPGDKVAFENHLNVFHRSGGGLPPRLARGLVAFLGSELVDRFIRQLSGHTQVNATDLRSLRYPSREELEALGSRPLKSRASRL